MVAAMDVLLVILLDSQGLEIIYLGYQKKLALS